MLGWRVERLQTTLMIHLLPKAGQREEHYAQRRFHSRDSFHAFFFIGGTIENIGMLEITWSDFLSPDFLQRYVDPVHVLDFLFNFSNPWSRHLVVDRCQTASEPRTGDDSFSYQAEGAHCSWLFVCFEFAV